MEMALHQERALVSPKKSRRREVNSSGFHQPHTEDWGNALSFAGSFDGPSSDVNSSLPWMDFFKNWALGRRWSERKVSLQGYKVIILTPFSSVFIAGGVHDRRNSSSFAG
jgi:hypothetical protein